MTASRPPRHSQSYWLQTAILYVVVAVLVCTWVLLASTQRRVIDDVINTPMEETHVTSDQPKGQG